ncbi:MAG: transcription-repair coupling factor [Gammaproteobacteria bacterium]|nr:transcription-repair coupling factor [Gammaproteobacteria bacterium]
MPLFENIIDTSEQLISVSKLTTTANSHKAIYSASMIGSSDSVALTELAIKYQGLLVVVVADTPSAQRLEKEIRFFSAGKFTVYNLPDWETLPYDLFSPHQDIISNRLLTLYKLPTATEGILIVPVSTLIQRLAPGKYLQLHSLILNKGDTLDPLQMRQRLTDAGYRHVEQVMEHGEFTLRGSLLDLYPMGSTVPYRIDFFDDEIDSIRVFDPDNQRSGENIDGIQLLPAREFPIDETGINCFRQNWRSDFDSTDKNSLYHQVSAGETPAGIEYYLPFFHQNLETLFNYLPKNSAFYLSEKLHQKAEAFWEEIEERYEQHRYDSSRPILAPKSLFLSTADIFAAFKQWPRIEIQDKSSSSLIKAISCPDLEINHKKDQPLYKFQEVLDQLYESSNDKLLICADTAGRRESIVELLSRNTIKSHTVESWDEFLDSNHQLNICIAPIDQGFNLPSQNLMLISENQLFGQQQIRQQQRKQQTIDPDSIIRNLAELKPGDPVVHIEQGIGRYIGLQSLTIGDIVAEYLTLEYSGGDKLYVPVHMLYLVSRYTGAGGQHAPLHKLGSEVWQKARKKAAERVRDIAAELLDLHAKRAAKPGFDYQIDNADYQQFADSFPFQLTNDQTVAIKAVLSDLQSTQPMDRLVCGDVGFGKTEVAMRAAFVVTQNTRQVAILVPTTLLAQQHFDSFSDRFADWPIRVEMISRFKTAKQQTTILKELAAGKIDILIGTHKLLNQSIKYPDLGLVVIDEEHRFGVSQKEKLKALRSEVDILTLTATPIPRTLNMSLSGMRDLSIIASPPARRLAIKTFVREFSKPLIREAIMREILRGGQVYFLHNDVASIENTAEMLAELVPEARINVGHGQMREKQLEQVMQDFYHKRFNVLVCSTIIETGIDVASANTIIMERADKLGLAQMHQLRGRVGRSHHQAYAFLMTPPRKQMSKDAIKRLEAVASLGDLGSGFILATQDMEIRGAGELLGDEQSGQIQSIGFSLYMEMLEEAVTALKEGREPSLHQSLATQTEIDLKVTVLIPEDYVADVGIRLSLYKRIANARTEQELDDLQVELIDRFGLLPQACKNLFSVSELKLVSSQYSIAKIEVNEERGTIEFSEKAPIEPLSLIELLQNNENDCKMNGATRLTFNGTFETVQERIYIILNLLGKLRVID